MTREHMVVFTKIIKNSLSVCFITMVAKEIILDLRIYFDVKKHLISAARNIKNTLQKIYSGYHREPWQ